MHSSNLSLDQLEQLWIKLWDEMFNTVIETEETRETATVLQEFLRRVETAKDVNDLKTDRGDLKTLPEWNREGRWIIKGQRAAKFSDNSEAMFYYDQTRPATTKKKTPIAEREYPNTEDDPDNLGDDIPF